jgi:ankyrin repeat protein
MKNIQDLPIEMRTKIYEHCDDITLLNFGETHVKYINEILRSVSPTRLTRLWFEATRKGLCRWISYIITKGIDINIKDRLGWSALLIATKEGQVLCVESLLKSRVLDLSVTTNFGQTALHIATRFNKLNIVKLLVKSSINLETRDRCGQTALHVACAVDINPEIINILLRAGANINSTSIELYTPLHVAADNGKIKQLKILISAGANLNQVASFDVTALFLAAASGHLPVVRALVDAGADTTVRDRFHRTPLDIAAHNRHFDVVVFLRR